MARRARADHGRISPTARRITMRSAKLLGPAFVVALAFSVFGAGSASGLLFLTQLAKESLTTFNLGKVITETKGGNKIECESGLASGLILNKTGLAHNILVTGHKCSSAFAGECNSAGEPKGLIKSLELEALLVTLLNGKYGLDVLSEKGALVEYECKNGLINEKVRVTGNLVGEFTETKAESEVLKAEMKLVFAKGANAGEPAIKDYWTLGGLGTAKAIGELTGAINETSELGQQGEGDGRPLFAMKFCHN